MGEVPCHVHARAVSLQTICCNIAANLAPFFGFAVEPFFVLAGLVILLCGVQAFAGLVAVVAAGLVRPVPRMHVAIGVCALVTGTLELWWLSRAMASLDFS